MNWAHLISYFFGGVFLANAVPHLVSGACGRRFQSPFARPPGQGLSTATVNVVWAFFNIVIGYILVLKVGTFDIRATPDFCTFVAGALFMSVFGARHFGQFYGGNRADKSTNDAQ